MKRLLFLLLVAAGRLTPAAAQIEWTPYEDNPVIDYNFDIESQATYRPSVLKWHGKYRMWYGKNWQNTGWEAYTTSDDGINWSNTVPFFDNAVLGPSDTDGTFDELTATFGWVIADGDTLKMWYAGQGSKASGIGFAWSLDGTTWTKVPGPGAGGSVLDPSSDGAGAALLWHPTVIKRDGMYHMWYVRVTLVSTNLPLKYRARLAYARSADGLSWQVVSGAGTNGAVIDLGAATDFDAAAIQWPSVLYNEQKGRFEAWYQGLYQDLFGSVLADVGCARSDDGIAWEKIPDSSSLAGECFRSVAQPYVFLENGLYKMWYALSASGTNGDVVMYATSGQAATAVEGNEVPTAVGTLEVYPNPTTSRANVRFSVQRQDAFVLEVRDLLGRLVARVDLGMRIAGEQHAEWNGSDMQGARVPSGAYLLSIAGSSTGEIAGSGIVEVVH